MSTDTIVFRFFNIFVAFIKPYVLIIQHPYIVNYMYHIMMFCITWRQISSQLGSLFSAVLTYLTLKGRCIAELVIPKDLDDVLQKNAKLLVYQYSRVKPEAAEMNCHGPWKSLLLINIFALWQNDLPNSRILSTL